MLKNKKANRWISNIVLAGLLTSTLPLNALAASPLTEAEVAQKIKQIKNVVNGFKALKITGISLLVTGVVGIIASAAAATGLLFFIPWGKLKRALNKMFKLTPKRLETLKTSEFISKYANDIENTYQQAAKKISSVELPTTNLEELTKKATDSNVLELVKKLVPGKTYGNIEQALRNQAQQLLFNPLAKYKGKLVYQETFKKLATTKIGELKAEMPRGKKIAKGAKKLWTKVKKVFTEEEMLTDVGKLAKELVELGGPTPKKLMTQHFESEIQQGLEKFIPEAATIIKNNLKKPLKIYATLGALSGGAAALFGLGGIGLIILGAIFGLTPVSVGTAYVNATELKELAQADLIKLTPKQKNIMAKFQDLRKKPFAQGFIKNMRLKNELTTIVNAAMQNTQKAVAALGEKLARKVFTDYIQAKRQKNLFQKALKEYAAMNITDTNTSKIQRQLNKTENKIRQLERDYPLLRTALESSTQNYIDAADRVLEELKEELIEAVEKRGFRPQPIAPVVPLT